MFSSRGNFLKQIISCNYRLIATKHTRKFEEIKIPVPWGHVAGKWWAPTNSRPILALHGFEDNCGTFDRLIPLLSNKVGFLAIDLPGHGYSSRIPPGLLYNFMDFIVLIKHIAEYFKWPKITLMGHSIGGILSYTYTMLNSEDVDYVMCIDGVKPLIQKNRMERIAKTIKELMRYNELINSTEEPPSYPMEVLCEKLATSNLGSVDLEQCHYIVKRNSAPSRHDPNKYYFSRDPRLRSRIIFNFRQDELVEGAARVTPPLLMLKFQESGYFERKENFYDVLEVLKKSSSDCQYHYLPGKHHTHLNNPEIASPLINDFIEKHANLTKNESHSKKLSGR